MHVRSSGNVWFSPPQPLHGGLAAVREAERITGTKAEKSGGDASKQPRRRLEALGGSGGEPEAPRNARSRRRVPGQGLREGPLAAPAACQAVKWPTRLARAQAERLRQRRGACLRSPGNGLTRGGFFPSPKPLPSLARGCCSLSKGFHSA